LQTITVTTSSPPFWPTATAIQRFYPSRRPGGTPGAVLINKQGEPMEAKVSSLMRRGALTCTQETSIQEVAQIMVVNKVRYCVVVDEQHAVKGIISTRSILKAMGRDLGHTRARDILLPYTITITPGTPLKEAADLMAKKRIEHLIVVTDRPESRAILGLLHAEDLIARMAANHGEEGAPGK
jgi:CBS domain-containing protein